MYPRLLNKPLKGLRLLKSDYPVAECFILYGGDSEEFREVIKVIPVERALNKLPEILEKAEV